MDIPASQPGMMGVRYLSNYAYCPRLFYLQWVEGIFIESAATVSGSSIHRQVDKPSHIDENADISLSPGQKLRSLKLESTELGLTGKIDLLEGGENGAILLDYKRGAAWRNSEGELLPKEYDELQVAAYVLLARGESMQINGAFIYYAADRKRVPVLLTDELFSKVINTLTAARNTAASGVCPEPLSDRGRCVYCSAYPVCLPGESRYWANPGSETPKELEPPNAEKGEGEVLVVQDARAFVGKHGDEVRVTKEGEIVSKIPIHQLRSIYLYGPVQLSAQLAQECLEENIDISYFASSGRFLGLLRGLPASGIDARVGQYRTFQDPKIKLGLAKEVVRGKIHNQRVMLMRNGEVTEAILGRLKALRDKAKDAATETELLGMEGEAASLYFSEFASMVKSADFDFKNRNRRPPKDPINAILSLGYSILAKELSGVCHTVGLDPFFGFYHHPRYGRPALALDLMEEFRPLTADSLAVSLINRGEVDAKSDFIFSSEGCALNESGRRAFWQGWFRRLDTEVTHPVFGYQMSYRRMFEIQARQLWRFVRGEAAGYTAFTTR